MKASVLYPVSKLLIATQPYLILLHTSRKVGISWCINTKNFNFDLRLHLRPYQTHLFFFNVPPSRFYNISRWIICYYQLLLFIIRCTSFSDCLDLFELTSMCLDTKSSSLGTSSSRRWCRLQPSSVLDSTIGRQTETKMTVNHRACRWNLNILLYFLGTCKHSTFPIVMKIRQQ